DIDVVSLSMAFFNDSFYDGTGPIADQVARLADHGVLLVASAGNYGQRHWKGSYKDGDGDGRLDFHGDNRLRIWLEASTSARSIYLAWNQHGSCGKTDLDAILYDDRGRIAYRADRPQRYEADQCAPVERLGIEVEQAGWYELEVTHARGAIADLEVSVLAPGGRVEFPLPGGIPDPGSSPHAITVGAVHAADYLTGDIEPFSSVGPTYAGYAKPDLVGPDGLSTSAYGAQGFFGTSAATPAVAGVIAVVMSEEPGLSAFEAAERVRAWSFGGHPPFGMGDPRLGAGRVRLPESPTLQDCGHRPLLALWLLPLGLWRRRFDGR
ncbi:MAG: S8 family serine peptidase, partial [Proteobacteria bacterium]|nr:S8 family serine peptidase [Pseudomonadota bacterium]